MKRLLMVSVLSLTAVFLVTSLAVSQTGISTSTTSSKVTPNRDKKKPYKVKTTGTITFPTALCAPNAPRANCLPLTCPAGVRDAKYCSRPTLPQICTGTVKVSFKLGRRTQTKTVRVKVNCKYSVTVTITRRGRVKVSSRFAGNTILAASKASTKRFRAG